MEAKLRAQIAKDLGLTEYKNEEHWHCSAVEGLVSWINQGYVESEALAEKYKALLCKHCRRSWHTTKKCNKPAELRALKKFLKDCPA